jgi:malate dehydrogenase (oxaloacetate-decarboxylating)
MSRWMATGRSDYPNQINNVLSFPGIFRGCTGLPRCAHKRRDEARCRDCDRGIISDNELHPEYIVPSVFR